MPHFKRYISNVCRRAGPLHLGVNFWLVMYTWLQHTDVDVPHLDQTHWTWEKGAFLTIDRPYGGGGWLQALNSLVSFDPRFERRLVFKIVNMLR